ncbi:MAG: AraC family transcriptional regulator [Burkholderiales bacterium]|nr:AraC family transcriptional regulator [Burkholderiales bacterium]
MLAPSNIRSDRLLEAHPIFVTHDIDQARVEVGRVFCAHHLQQTQAAQQLDCHMHRVALGALSLNYLCYGADVDIRPGCLEDFYLVQIPLAGYARIRYGDRMVESDCTTASILSPHRPVAMHWQGDCAQIMLHVPRQLMEQQCRQWLGQDHAALEYEPALTQRTGPTAGWCQTVVDLARNIDAHGNGWLQHPAAAASLQEFLLHGLLIQQPYRGATPAAESASAVLPRHVRRAQEFIDAQAEQAITMDDIARAACVSERTLQAGFRRHLGTTPSAYLREVRLHRVHEHLRFAADNGLAPSVFDVAHRYGFFHLGRFAAYYKMRFGETPSATLKHGGRLPSDPR